MLLFKIFVIVFFRCVKLFNIYVKTKLQFETFSSDIKIFWDCPSSASVETCKQVEKERNT